MQGSDARNANCDPVYADCNCWAIDCVVQDQQELEGSKFKKLCTDCGLLDKKFTVTDVDLIFVKVHDIAHSFT